MSPHDPAPSISNPPWDVIVVGAGPAGLSAGLILGRCVRRVLLIDDGTPRSWAAHHVYGFLTRDGATQDEFRRAGRGQLERYPTVEFKAGEVKVIEQTRDGSFEVRIAGLESQRARKVLLATGVFDELPAIPGIEDFFGISAHPCPYCDGWEMHGTALAVYGEGERGFEMARAMTAWSSQVVLCTGGSPLEPQQRRELEANGIGIVDAPISRLVGHEGRLEAIDFVGGERIRCDALFFDTPSFMQSPLAAALGCAMNPGGRVKCGPYAETSVPGVFAAGNMAEGVQLSIVAAADGARAAFGINRALTREDFAARARRYGAVRAN